MKIMVCGANGLVGREACVLLKQQGHEVIRVVRRAIQVGDVAMDFGQPLTVADWLPHLVGIDVVVNTVGQIKETSLAGFDQVHYQAAKVLFDACLQAGVGRVVQLSALGVEAGGSRYFTSKYAADQYLMSLPLEWVILRPSLIYGPQGGSAALLDALASMPIIPVPFLPNAVFSPVHIGDVVQAIALSVQPASPAGCCIDVVGPDRVSLRQMLGHYRQNMGLGGAIWLTIPRPVMSLLARGVGCLPGAVFNRDTWGMLQEGNAGNPTDVTVVLGWKPIGIEQFVTAESAICTRQRAVSCWRRPLFQWVLAAIWLVTAWVSAMVYPVKQSLALLGQAGLHGAVALWALYGACVVDSVMGLGCLLFPSKTLWRAQIALIAGYSLVIGVAMPAFLMHPFGPILKNLPILAILLVLLAEEEK